MSNKWGVKPEETEFFKELDECGAYLESLPTSNLDCWKGGIIIEEERVIGLGVTDSKIHSLPESIGNLQYLDKLFLCRNQLTTLPESIGELKCLKELNVVQNKLITIPESIGNLQSLKKLLLCRNQLTELPESIGNLQSLGELDLSENQLTTLPESFAKLKSLFDLNLSENKLISLPDSIGDLKELRWLKVKKNNLSNLPGSIWKLKDLKSIELEENPWEGEWRNMVERDVPSIREFCRRSITINIFLSHAVAEFGTFKIKEISEFLEKQDEIYKVFYCEQDLMGNIDDFMDEKIPQSQLVLFFASNKSVFNSEDCKHELEFARKHNIQIIPIKGPDLKWEELKERALSRELGYEFDQKDFDKFYEKLWNYIKKFKRDINLFDPKQAKIDRERLNLKSSLNSFIESESFKVIFANHYEEFAELFQDLSSYHISSGDYIIRSLELIYWITKNFYGLYWME